MILLKNLRIFVSAISVLAMLVGATAARACSLRDNSPWYFHDEKLVSSTKTIILGKLIKQNHALKDTFNEKVENVFEVVKVLKGKLDAKTISVTARSNETDGQSDKLATYGPDCRLQASFKDSKLYLIFVGSFHPSGYREVSGPKDPWVEKIEHLLNSKPVN